MVHGTHVRATTSGTGQVRSQKVVFLSYFPTPSKFSHNSFISLMNSKNSQRSFAPATAIANKNEIYDIP